LVQNKEIKDFFDGLASGWDNCPQEYEIREKLTQMIGFKKNSLIADIGCGKGVLFEHLLKTEPQKIIAIDLSGEMLKSAKELFPDERIIYINDDFLNVSLPPVDAAILFNAYPHFLNKKSLAKKLADSVRPGGYAIIAHSLCKEKINAIHNGGTVFRLSVPLKPANEETKAFLPYFLPEKIVDTNELYLIKMKRIPE
jgi:Methylase involved in ubiquinone/menaquinone biosynthesis